MAAARRVMELEFTEQELADLERVSRSRTEPASHVQRARILLGYRQTPSLYVTGRAIGVTHQTVERCLRRARDLGVRRRSTTGRVRDASGRSAARRGRSSSTWLAASPRTWTIRMRCGRRGF